MKNNKAFTLVELIATIVIITLILLMALPSVYKITKDNSKKEYEYYYKVAKEAAYVYADAKKEQLGGSLGMGCIGGTGEGDSQITIENLIELGFLKPFSKRNIEYSGNVVIRNNYGKLTINLYMQIDGNEYGTQDNNECLAYIPTNKPTLSEKLMTLNTYNEKNNNYIVGENPNNYVWYSGKLWRAVLIGNDNKQTMLITDDIISVIPFDKEKNGLLDSYVDSWLNNYFLNNLYESKRYVSNDIAWDGYNYKKVGLISKEDFEATKDSNDKTFLDIENYRYWILDKKLESANKQYAVDLGKVEYYSTSTAIGVRPAISIYAGIKVIEGEGTKENPYQLEGNAIQNINNEHLNTRTSGEYVKINDILYRIVNIVDNKTKLVSVDAITIDDVTNKTMNNQNYTLSNIYTYLNGAWYESLSIKNKISLGDWCIASEEESLNLTECTNNKSFKIGLPKYGELFASDFAKTNNNFWTLTPDNTNGIISISKSNIIGLETGKVAGVKPSFYLDSTTTINSGSGTETDPFVL